MSINKLEFEKPENQVPVSPPNAPNPLNIRNLEDFLLKKRDKIRGFFEAIETLSPAETPADQIRAAREGRPSGVKSSIISYEMIFLQYGRFIGR